MSLLDLPRFPLAETKFWIRWILCLIKWSILFGEGLQLSGRHAKDCQFKPWQSLSWAGNVSCLKTHHRETMPIQMVQWPGLSISQLWVLLCMYLYVIAPKGCFPCSFLKALASSSFFLLSQWFLKPYPFQWVGGSMFLAYTLSLQFFFFKK